MINRMICQTAPEVRPETRIRFAKGETPMRSRPLRPATHCFPLSQVVINLVSAADYFLGYVFFLHRIASSPRAMVYCLSGFRPAGNILSILLILSKH